MATLRKQYRTAQIYMTVDGLIFDTASEQTLFDAKNRLQLQYGSDRVGIFADPPTWELHPDSPNNKAPFAS